MTSEWRKSTYSDTGGQCIECRSTERTVSIRDTQNRERGHLSFPTSEWTAFLDEVRTGRL